MSTSFRPAAMLAGLFSASLCLLPRVAHADVSSWLFLGGGASLRDRSGSSDLAPTMQIDTGLGSSPKDALVLGGLARLQTRFGDGTDLGLFLRTATGGYVRGAWGVALDLGTLQRWHDSFAPGYAGTLSLGAPWGITLNLDGARDQHETSRFALVIGIDLARFSVYRTTGVSWFPNEFGIR